MNKQKEFEKLMVNYRSVEYENIENCGKRMNEVWDWIQQNYVSKDKVRELKDEIQNVLEYKPRKDDDSKIILVMDFKSKADIINVNNSIDTLLK